MPSQEQELIDTFRDGLRVSSAETSTILSHLDYVCERSGISEAHRVNALLFLAALLELNN